MSEEHERPSTPQPGSGGEPREAAKPGFFRRLFGRKGGAAEEDRSAEPAEAAVETASDQPPQADREPEAEQVAQAEEAPQADQAPRAEQSPQADQEPEPEAEVRTAAEALPEAPPPAAAEPLETAATAQPVPVEAAAPESAPQPPLSWWARLRKGLSRSSGAIGTGIAEIFTKRKLDATMLEELEDVLIRADLGVGAATRVTEAVGKGRYDKNIAADEVKQILAAEVERVLAPYGTPLAIDKSKKPFVILVVGVNGSGKTTTIGKLAAKFSRDGHKVVLAAGDTFRAAAIEQLRIWGGRLDCPVIAREQGGDAAGLGFDAIKAAQESGADILLMDTAGRLQNRTELMAELEKIIRVMKKLDQSAPHAVLLVLDATVGQNAMSQVEIFGRIAGVTGLVMTKLDGTARGGILVAIAEKFNLPIHYIGVGESADDLASFEARDFARAIAGLDA